VEFGPHLVLALLEGAVIAAVLAMTAMGLSLVFGVMRVVNVAHGEFFMLGAVIAWWVTSMIGSHPAFGFVAALIIAPIVVGLIAAVADRFILQKINYDPDRTIVGTIGLLYIIQQATLMSFGPDARAVEAPFNKRLAIPWFQQGENGLELYWPGAGLAAIGAVLIVPVQQAHYLMGHDPLLLSFIVVIIGGLGSLPGTVIAAVLIGMSDGIVSVFFSPTLAKIIATLLVALVLVFRPNGLMGKAST